MAYTEDQKAAFRTEFALRRKRQLFISLPLVIMMIGFLIALDEKTKAPVFGLPQSVAVGVLAVVAIAGVVISLLNWRCPACQRYLGKQFNPSFCPRCGVALR